MLVQKKKISKVDLDVYTEKLDNGLSIYVVPMPNKNNIHATFSTDFGSITNEFVPIGEKKMIRVP